MSELAVEDMTLEQIAAERLALSEARLALAAVREEATVEPPEPVEAEVDAGEATPAPWPHSVIEFEGAILEVRKPNESSLLAISMVGAPGIPPQVQSRIFTKFLTHHFSSASLAYVLESMTDPDSAIDVQELIRILTTLPG